MHKKFWAGMLSLVLVCGSGGSVLVYGDTYAASKYADIEEQIAREESTVFEELKKNTEENDCFPIELPHAGAAQTQEEIDFSAEENEGVNAFSTGKDLFDGEDMPDGTDLSDGLADGKEGDVFSSEEEQETVPDQEQPEDTHEMILQAQDGDDITENLNLLLMEAKERATDENPCKVIIPPGSYQITDIICMYSNIHLYAVGAVITKMSPDKKIMLRLGNTVESAGGYDGYRNVTIEGGTWDANYETVPDKEANGGFVGFRIGHASHIVIKDATFLNNLKSHFIELGGVKDAKVTGCTFRGYWEPFEGGGQECIQIDACQDFIFPGYLPYDRSTCEDIYIEGNLFENVFAGVGSHSMIFDRPYKNIVIRGNTFRNIKKRAVWCLNYQDSVVENNVMTNVGGGVYVRSLYSHNTHLAEGQEAVNTGNQQPENIVVANNEITISSPVIIDGSMWNSFGINIVGEKCGQPSGVVPQGNYFVRNITVKNNKISGQGNGIRLILAENCTLSNNTVNVEPSEIIMNMGICLGGSSSNTITTNKIQCGKSGGIYVYKGPEGYTSPSINNIITNNTVSGNSGDGIVLNTQSDGVKIEKNKISKVPGTGILAMGNKNITITGNTVSGCGLSGIEVSKSGSGAVINKNTSSQNKGRGILISASKNASVTGNTMSQNASDGIRVESSSTKAVVKSNTCSKNKGYGILIYSSTSASVSGNKISENYKDGIRIHASSNKATIASNQCLSNKKYGIAIVKSTLASVSKNKIQKNKGYGFYSIDSSVKVYQQNQLKGNAHTDVFYLKNTEFPGL